MTAFEQYRIGIRTQQFGGSSCVTDRTGGIALTTLDSTGCELDQTFYRESFV